MPRQSVKLVLWLRSFATALGEHGPTLQLSAQEMADGQADALYVAATLELQQDAARFAKAWTVHKRAVLYGSGNTAWPSPFLMWAELPAPRPAGAMRRITRLVKRIKFSPPYRSHLGIAFDILGTDQRARPSEFAEIQPRLKVVIGPEGRPVIRWRKRGLTGSRSTWTATKAGAFCVPGGGFHA